MNVVLRVAVKGLGRAGEVVPVGDAHARNFLFPRKMAIPATEALVARQKNAEQQSAQHIADQRAAVLQLAEQLRNARVEVRGKANPQGKLFAALKSADIVHALEQQFHVHLGNVDMQPSHLKTVGQHEVEIRVSGQSLTVVVNVQHG